MERQWALLPHDLRRYVLSFLPVRYRCSLRYVSKWWRSAIDQTITEIICYEFPRRATSHWIENLPLLLSLEVHHMFLPGNARLCSTIAHVSTISKLVLTGLLASSAHFLVDRLPYLTSLDFNVERYDVRFPDDWLAQKDQLREVALELPWERYNTLVLQIPTSLTLLDVYESIRFLGRMPHLKHLYCSSLLDIPPAACEPEVLSIEDGDDHARLEHAWRNISLRSLRHLELEDAPDDLFRSLLAAPLLKWLHLNRWRLPDITDECNAVLNDFNNFLELCPPLEHLWLPRLCDSLPMDSPNGLPDAEAIRKAGGSSYLLYKLHRERNNYWMEASDRVWRTMIRTVGSTLRNLQWTAWSISVETLQLMTGLRCLETMFQYGGDDAMTLPWLFRLCPVPDSYRGNASFELALPTYISPALFRWLLSLKRFHIETIESYETDPFFHNQRTMLAVFRSKLNELPAELRDIEVPCEQPK